MGFLLFVALFLTGCKRVTTTPAVVEVAPRAVQLSAPVVDAAEPATTIAADGNKVPGPHGIAGFFKVVLFPVPLFP